VQYDCGISSNGMLLTEITSKNFLTSNFAKLNTAVVSQENARFGSEDLSIILLWTLTNAPRHNSQCLFFQSRRPTKRSHDYCFSCLASYLLYNFLITYLMKHLIYTICSSHRNDHRTSSIDCDPHKLMNTILCELKNLKHLLSLSPLIIINNILSGVLAIIAFYPEA